MHRRAVAVVLASAVAAALCSSPAWAHNELSSSNPKSDAVLQSAPKTVTLTFAEPADARFVQIAVKTADGKLITTPKPTVSGATVSQQVDGLSDGGYTVAYRVVSQDGHPITGKIAFTLASPAASPTPSADSGGAGAPGKEIVPSAPTVQIEPAAIAPTADNRGRTRVFLYVVVALLCLGGIAAAGLHLVSATNRRPKRRGAP